MTLAEVLAAFSLAIDLGLGQPMEHLLRSWRIAARLADRLEVPGEQRTSLFYVAMLAWVGCVADAPEVAASFGDDIAFRAGSYDVDLAGLPALGFFVSYAGSDRPAAGRLRAAATLVATGGAAVARGIQGHCLSTSTLADQLGLDPGVSVALRQFFARWDGKGVPPGVRGEELAQAVRLFHLADVVEVHHRRGGAEAAIEVARARRGSQFDPAIVDVFCMHASEVLPSAADGHDMHRLFAVEPGLANPLSEDELDGALQALADFTDLRSACRAGHSRGVGDLAGAAAESLGCPRRRSPQPAGQDTCTTSGCTVFRRRSSTSRARCRRPSGSGCARRRTTPSGSCPGRRHWRMSARSPPSPTSGWMAAATTVGWPARSCA